MARHVRLIALLGAILGIGTLAPMASVFASATAVPSPAESVGPAASAGCGAGVLLAKNDAPPDIQTPSPIGSTVLDVLGNDCGGGATPSRPLTITGLSQPAHGSVTTDGRTVVYNPNGCYTGLDLFTYTITDGISTAPGLIRTATVIFTVARPTTLPITDAPSVGFVGSSTIGSTVPLRVSWCGVPTAGAVVTGYRVRQSNNNGRTYSAAPVLTGPGTASIRNVVPGLDYRWQALTNDNRKGTGGYATSAASRVTLYQDNSRSIRYSYGWKSTTSSRFSGRTERTVTRSGATATLTVSNARQFAVVASRGSGKGSFHVYVDGHRVTTTAINERGANAWRRVLYVGSIPGNTAASHTIQLRTASRARVSLDAILTLSGRQSPTVSITSAAPAAATYGDTPYTIRASSSSGLPVTLAVKPTSWAVCALNGTVVTFHGIGTCAMAATSAGDPTWYSGSAIQSFTVSPAPLTVTGIAARDRPYNGTTAAPLQLTSPTILGRRSGDNAAAVALDTRAAAATFTNANAGAAKPVTVTGLVLTGTRASRYTIVPLHLTASIAKADQVITFDTIAPTNAVKDGPGLTVAAHADSGLPVTLGIAPISAAVCTISGRVVSFPGSGPCNVLAGQAGDANRNAAPTAVLPFSVASTGTTPQAITFDSIGGVTYGHAPVGLTVSASSGLPVALASVTTNVCSVSGTTVTILGAGTCHIDADQAGNPTFAAATQVDRFFTVAQKGITVTGITAGDKTYDGSPSATLDTGSAALVGRVGTDNVTLGTNAVAGTFASTNAGIDRTVTISGLTLAGAKAGSYSLTQPTTTATIGKATLTVTADRQAIVYGDGDPLFTFTYGAFVNGEGPGAIGTPPTCSVAGASRTVAGSPYAITCAGGSAVNYTFNPRPGQLTVSAKPLTLSFTVADKAFDGSTAAAITGCTLATVEPGDTATCSHALATAAFGSPAVGNAKTVTGSGFTLAGANAGNYSIGTITTATADITLAAQVITFTSLPPTPGTAAGATYVVSATGGASGNPVAFSSGTPAVCTVSTVTVTFLTEGTCTIRANQAGNASYAAATQATQDVTVARNTQAITFDALAGKTYGNAPFAVSADASSGLGVSFSSQTLPVCTVSGSTVTLLRGGTCTIRAAQAGNSTYQPATDVDRGFTVTRATLTVTADPQSMSYGTAEPSPYTFAYGTFIGGDNAAGIDTPPTCTVVPAHTAVGSYPITCSGGLDDKYQFSFVGDVLTITKANQEVSFNEPVPTGAVAVVGNSAVQTATATSGLTATVTVDAGTTNGACSLTGSTVSFDAAGTCVLAANQAGNTSWNAAAQVLRSFTISLTPQTISFTQPADTTYGEPADLTATATSGLTVTLTSRTAGICTVSSATVTTHATGTCTVRASQAGNANWATAPTVDRSFTVAARPITVTALTASKTADGTTSATGTPTVTAGSLAAGDTESFTQAFDAAAAGTGRSVVPGGTIQRAGSDVTARYTITWQSVAGSILPAAASLANSTITAAPGTLAGDGSSVSAITVRLIDAFGNPLATSGGTVTLGVTGPGTVGAVTDGGDGTYSATYTSGVVGAPDTATITGALDGQALASTAMITLTP